MWLDLNAGEVREGCIVGADNRTGGGLRSCCDDQIVRPAGSSLESDMNEQLGVELRDSAVIVENGDDRQHVLKEGEAGCSLLSRGQEHTDSQLGCGDGGDRYLVVVVESFVEVGG
jgi:hypothetical protein